MQPIVSSIKKIVKILLLSPVLKYLVGNSKDLYLKMPIPIRKRFDPLAKKIYFTIKHTNSVARRPTQKFTGSDWIRDIQPYLGSERKYEMTIILPSLRSGTLTAGPGIAIQIAASVAALGRNVRIATIDGFMGEYLIPTSEILKYLSDTLEIAKLPETLTFEVLHESLEVGPNETFLATAWQTFRLAADSQMLAGNEAPPFYLIQDFEPLLHNSSSEYVLAEETYSLPHLPIVASQILAEFFTESKIGITAEQLGNVETSHVIPLPRVPTHLASKSKSLQVTGIIDLSKRNLLFYARPGVASRNLFEVGVLALQKSIEIGLLNPTEWNFIGAGAKFDDMALTDDAILRCAPWLDYESYLDMISRSDVYLALMNSPHTGFPVIEAVQLHIPAVTNTFKTKNLERLKEISNGIYASEPNVVSIVESLSRAIANDVEFDVNLKYFEDLIESHQRLAAWINSKIPNSDNQELDLLDHSQCYTCDQKTLHSKTNLSFLTIAVAIYNIDLSLLQKFLQSLERAQIFFDESVQIIILNNGSTLYNNDNLRRFVKKILPKADYLFKETNNGIVSGMQTLLSHAQGSYFIPMDADDLVATNAFSIISKHIEAEPNIDFWYSNEWLLSGSSNYAALRYEFDPVLLTEICFTTHLNIFKTNVAKELQIYEFAPNGSHDWFSAIQFLKAGRRFKHLNHFLYFWRMHETSTSENWTSKPYVKDSQWAVLQDFANSVDKSSFEIKKHPKFIGSPNGRIYSKTPMLDSEILRIDFDNSGNPLTKLGSSPSILKSSHYFVWLGCGPTQVSKNHLLEISTLAALWPNAVFTGPSILTNGHRMEPPENETWTSELMRPHYSLKSLCRRTVQDILPTNIVVPAQILREILWDENWDLPKTVGSVRNFLREHCLSVIFSPDLVTDSENTLSLNNMQLLHDLSLLAVNRVEVYVEDQHASKKFSKVELTFDRYKDLNVPCLEMLTTLRGGSSALFLEELFESLKEQLTPSITWRILVHGEQSKSITELITKLSIVSEISIIEIPEPLSLEEALRKALNTSKSDWIFLVDYDDKIFPHTLKVICNVMKEVTADVYVGNEIIGSDYSNSLYFKRNIPNQLSLSLYSQFFHPIISKRESLLGLLDAESNYVVDWQIVDKNIELQKIAFIDLPLYFWRSHPTSTTNKKEGSSESKKVVKSRLQKLVNSQPTILGLTVSSDNSELQIVKKGGVLPKICLQIVGRGSIQEKSKAIQRFKDKYLFHHISIDPTTHECQCGSEYVLSLPVDIQPTTEFDLFPLLALIPFTEEPFLGMILDERNTSSNLFAYNQSFRIFRDFSQALPTDDLFRKLEHLPVVKIKSLSPSLIPNSQFGADRLKQNFGIFATSLNVASIDTRK